uniref:Uncharacterized protein n=1 Tax=Hyaloperonospora arabidopsidis (strain Emoy2) TaxID=559515 RepID=M4BNW2_HYAAE
MCDSSSVDGRLRRRLTVDMVMREEKARTYRNRTIGRIRPCERYQSRALKRTFRSYLVMTYRLSSGMNSRNRMSKYTRLANRESTRLSVQRDVVSSDKVCTCIRRTLNNSELGMRWVATLMKTKYFIAEKIRMYSVGVAGFAARKTCIIFYRL